MHAQGEKTTLPDQCADLVSLTTVMHELPRSAAKAVFLEARRILRPGGALTLVDMDPTESFMQYMDGYAGLFKAGIRATEPHLIEYCTIGFKDLLKECGFTSVMRTRNTVRHCIYTACIEGDEACSEADAPLPAEAKRTGHPQLLVRCLDPVRLSLLLEEGTPCEFSAGSKI